MPNPATSELEIVSGQQNLANLMAYYSIVPEQERHSLLTISEWDISSSQLSTEVLLVRRTSVTIGQPNQVAGVLGADHPQNPFGVPVMIETLLTGQPPRELHAETISARTGAELTGSFNRWNYAFFGVMSQQDYRQRTHNRIDPSRLAQALDGSGDPIIDLLGLNPGEANGATLLESSPPILGASYSGQQIRAHMGGPLATLSGGEVQAHAGFEWRKESARFTEVLGEEHREIRAAYGQVRIPVVGPEMDIAAVRTLYVTSGFRADDYSDIGSGRSYQHGFTWKPHELLEVRGTRGTSLRAPSLYDLYYPRIVQTSQVVDPRRHESVPVTFTVGGNPDLKPTRGESWSIGFAADNGGRWRFSLDH